MIGRIILRYLLEKDYALEEIQRKFENIELENRSKAVSLLFEVLDSIEDEHVDPQEILRLKRKAYDLLIDLNMDGVIRETKKDGNKVEEERSPES